MHDLRTYIESSCKNESYTLLSKTIHSIFFICTYLLLSDPHHLHSSPAARLRCIKPYRGRLVKISSSGKRQPGVMLSYDV